MLASLEGTNLRGARLGRTDLTATCLSSARLQNADLAHARMRKADLRGTDVRQAVVDGETNITDLTIDRETDFRGVALESATVQPKLRGQLQYNCRRLEWRDWYGEHRLLRWPMWLFWSFSDYGRSISRILLWFVALSVFFAVIYGVCGAVTGNGPVEGLFTVTPAGNVEAARVPWHVVPTRALYFSVVTMTTLGFGDLHARPTSHAGHWLLMVQVFLGYILLGALLTRFAVMFQGGIGPVPKVPPAEGPIRQNSPWWLDVYRVQKFRARLMRFVRPVVRRMWYGGGGGWHR